MNSSAQLIKAPKAKPLAVPASPIDILQNDTAKFYTHLHPILVLSLYALQFNSLVADPVSTLFNTLLPVGILQIAYVAICLPPTGSKTAAAAAATPKPGAKKKPAPGRLESGIQGKIIVGSTPVMLDPGSHITLQKHEKCELDSNNKS